MNIGARITWSIAGITVMVAAVGCAAEPAPEETAETSDAFVLGTTSRMFPRSDGVCDSLSVIAAGSAALTVQLATASGGCAAGALVTTAGLAEPVCLLPAAGTALAGLAALLAGGAAALVCRTARNGYSQVAVDAAARSRPGQTCDDGTVNQLEWVKGSGNACGSSRSCERDDSCAVLSAKIKAGSNCIDARRQIQACFDPNDPDLLARKNYAAHEAEIENVKRVVVACRARQETMGCP